MARLTYKRYQRQVLLTMTVYVAFMLGVWPLVRTTHDLPLKLLLALLPVLPVLCVIGLMARHIRDSDELEQRMHLLALGVATAVVGTLSLIGGFLAAAQLWRPDGTILIWVFPALMASYGVTRAWVRRRYGMGLACEEDEGGVPVHLRFVLMALAIAAVALLGRHALDDGGFGLLCGMSGGFALLGMVLGIVRWRACRAHDNGLR